MFTGIIEEIGVVKEVSHDRLAIKAHKVLEETKVGDSMAINGVCLTVVSLENHGFSVNVMPETLRRTNLRGLHYNDQVNLERALAVGGRLGGHLVLGHVDDTGEVMDVTSEETARLMRISAPAKLMPYIVDKGFIAVDGVSLTIAGFDDLSFVVSLVAYTMEHTTLGKKRPGDVVNLETDVVAKYVESLKERKKQDLSLEFLAEYGFIGGTHNAVDAG
ncbi:MAG: riboflavin synthase [Chloroflexi bacterium]|nr:MAG: riboflavin synthase [Chloroflexota bacterium]